MDSGLITRSTRRLLKPGYLAVKRMFFRSWFAGLKRELPLYGRVLVVAPHPDDEALGLGGTILRFLDGGTDVHILFMTQGEASHDDLDKAAVSRSRTRISDEVLACMGIDATRVTRWSLPDGAIPRRGASGFEEAAGRLGEVLETVRPEALFVTHPMETWPYDHVASFEIAEAALNEYSGSCDFYGYVVWLWYSLPMRMIFSINRAATYTLPVGTRRERKEVLVRHYLEPLAPNGKPWSGVLPKAMLKALEYPCEVLTRLA